jgi:seryl-tRNA synthetase
MHDINWIRDNPEEFVRQLARRSEVVDIDRILALDKDKKGVVKELQALQQERNAVSQSLAKIDKASSEFQSARQKVLEINEQIQILKVQETELEQQLYDMLSVIPNMLDPVVPDGNSEDENVVVSRIGTPRTFDFAPKAHYELGEALGMMDFTQTAHISGSRFVSLFGDLARLERALAQFMLDMHTQEFGFVEVSVPQLVKSNAMYGTGNLPKFGDDAFATTNGYWLIPTSEVPLTNLVADKITNSNDLPLRYTAFSQCFRSEAGSAGKDTRGMVRLHQFSKVELVTIAREDNYESEFEHLCRAAEEVLVRLELPYQKMLKCTFDTTTFSSQKTYDLEVWLPAQDKYREISSCSGCGQFPARRMNARYKKAGDKETTFVYTMNGSGLAVGRTIVAILENYQNKDGSITIPDVIRPYMNGQSTIAKHE